MARHGRTFPIAAHRKYQGIPGIYLYRSTSQQKTEAVTLTDSKITTPFRILIENITNSDTLNAMKVVLKQLTDALILTDTIVRLTQHVMTEVVSLVDTVNKIITHLFSEVAVLTDVITSITTKIREYLETVTATDFVAKSVTRILAEAASFADTFSKMVIRVKDLAESLTLTDTVARVLIKIYTETISLYTYTIVKLNGIVTNGWSKVAKAISSWTKSNRN